MAGHSVYKEAKKLKAIILGFYLTKRNTRFNRKIFFQERGTIETSRFEFDLGFGCHVIDYDMAHLGFGDFIVLKIVGYIF